MGASTGGSGAAGAASAGGTSYSIAPATHAVPAATAPMGVHAAPGSQSENVYRVSHRSVAIAPEYCRGTRVCATSEPGATRRGCQGRRLRIGWGANARAEGSKTSVEYNIFATCGCDIDPLPVRCEKRDRGDGLTAEVKLPSLALGKEEGKQKRTCRGDVLRGRWIRACAHRTLPGTRAGSQSLADGYRAGSRRRFRESVIFMERLPSRRRVRRWFVAAATARRRRFPTGTRAGDEQTRPWKLVQLTRYYLDGL